MTMFTTRFYAYIYIVVPVLMSYTNKTTNDIPHLTTHLGTWAAVVYTAFLVTYPSDDRP